MLHTLVKNYLQEFYVLLVPGKKPTLYEQLPIGKLLQPDQPPPYTQGQAEGPYYLKSPDKRGR